MQEASFSAKQTSPKYVHLHLKSQSVDDIVRKKADEQTLLSFECSNPIWGTTTHPLDTGRTCGGSSGGEAVMVAMRGSPIGWGNDSKSSLILLS
jgi:hypothetical protein